MLNKIFLSLCFVLLLGFSSSFAQEEISSPALDQVGQVDVDKAPPRVMTLYEQGWEEGVKVGRSNSGKIGWMGLGVLTNVPGMWLPWVVEPRRPAKPPIQAEEEFNSGFKNGYRAGWKNDHKAFYIIGAVIASGAATGVILANQ
ncbi:hypothetical protein IT157_01770 [bacterium]|jgi:hypothetical protein|nr:hypothetical protein [bacterium]